MKARILFFNLALYLISITTPVTGQNREADSLSRLALKTSDPLEKINLLNALCFQLIPSDLKKAGEVAEEAIRISRKTKNDLLLGWSLFSKGVCLQTAGENSDASKIFGEILSMNKVLKNNALEGYILSMKANMFRDQGDFDTAASYYLKARVKMAPEKDEQFNLISHLELARHFIVISKIDEAEKEIDQALKILKTNGSAALHREAWLLKGIQLIYDFRYAEGEEFLNKAELLSQINSTSWLRIKAARGDIRFLQGDFTEAIDIWKSMLNAEKEIGYKYDLAGLLLKLAEAYSEQGYRKIAGEYLNTCLEISERSGFNFLRSEALYEVAWIAYRTKNFKLALRKVDEAEKNYSQNKLDVLVAACNNLRGLIYMDKNMYDSSLYFHNLSYKTRLARGGKVAISSSLFNMGELFVKSKEYKKALEFLHRGLKIDEAINDNYGKSLYYYQLSQAHNGLKQFDSVEYFLQRTIRNAVPNSAYEILQKSYLDMATLLQRAGKSGEAFNYLESFISISDSLYNKQTAQTLAAYETLFEVDKKEKEIEILNKDKQLVEANNRIQRLVLYVLGTGLLFLIGMVIFFGRMGMRLRVLNKANEEKAVELLKANSALQQLYTDIKGNNLELKETLEKLSQAQEHLLRSEKMASLGVLAAGVAHELNNPLNFIKGGLFTLETQAAKEGRMENAEFKHSMSIINEGINRATTILKGLGQYSRQSENMTETCDLNKILDNCLVILSNSLKYHVRVVKNFSSTPPLITGNAGKLHQAFMNIINNAEQSIIGEGSVTLTTKTDGNEIQVSITDTGSGISKENMKRLGDLFFTTKEPGKGTGLGLSISYKIIQDHDGKIAVESEVGKGTTIKITFKSIGI
ncbi:MAG: ATP-binding protein [Cyclobacteriaceae bacterium]